MDKMDKIVVKVVISLVLGFLLSFLIAPFESMRSAIGETISSVIAWIVMIALFVVIYLIAGQSRHDRQRRISSRGGCGAHWHQRMDRRGRCTIDTHDCMRWARIRN